MRIQEEILRELITNHADFTSQLKTIVYLYKDLDLHRKERLKTADTFITHFSNRLNADNLEEFVIKH